MGNHCDCLGFFPRQQTPQGMGEFVHKSGEFGHKSGEFGHKSGEKIPPRLIPLAIEDALESNKIDLVDSLVQLYLQSPSETDLLIQGYLAYLLGRAQHHSLWLLLDQSGAQIVNSALTGAVVSQRSQTTLIRRLLTRPESHPEQILLSVIEVAPIRNLRALLTWRKFSPELLSQALIQAIVYDRVKVGRLLIQAGTPLTPRVLDTAAEYASLDLLDIILQETFSPGTLDQALCSAAKGWLSLRKSYSPVIKRLLQSGAQDRTSALLVATQAEHQEGVLTLLAEEGKYPTGSFLESILSDDETLFQTLLGESPQWLRAQGLFLARILNRESMVERLK